MAKTRVRNTHTATVNGVPAGAVAEVDEDVARRALELVPVEPAKASASSGDESSGGQRVSSPVKTAKAKQGK